MCGKLTPLDPDRVKIIVLILKKLSLCNQHLLELISATIEVCPLQTSHQGFLRAMQQIILSYLYSFGVDPQGSARGPTIFIHNHALFIVSCEWCVDVNKHLLVY
jgi:hypothetical protein